MELSIHLKIDFCEEAKQKGKKEPNRKYKTTGEDKWETNKEKEENNTTYIISSTLKFKTTNYTML